MEAVNWSGVQPYVELLGRDEGSICESISHPLYWQKMLLKSLMCVQETVAPEALWELPFLLPSLSPSHSTKWGGCCSCLSCPDLFFLHPFWACFSCSFVFFALDFFVLICLFLFLFFSSTSSMFIPGSQEGASHSVCVHACTHERSRVGEGKSVALGHNPCFHLLYVVLMMLSSPLQF